MDYEKAYNEALERAKRLRCLKYQTMNAKRVVDEIFPQLAESEDERMLRTIIRGFKNWKANGMETFNNIKVDDILSYLEKQKESLHISETCKEKANSFTDIIEVRSFQRGIEEERRLEKQKEQKDYRKLYDDIAKSDWFKKAYHGKSLGVEDEQKEQKPVEWSDNFEDNIRTLLHDKLTWHSEDGNMSSTVFIDDKTLKDIISGIWFYVGKEALKYPNKELNVPEWSDEDERNIDTLVSVIWEHYTDYDLVRDDYPINARGLVDWLKFLRPQPHWKPSKKQMEALNYFIKLWGNSDDQLEYTKIFNTVKSLRNDLEKQM